MKKNNKNVSQARDGFDSLVAVHTSALQENSREILEMLEILSEKKLSPRDLKTLKYIKRELKDLDDEIDKIGDN